MYFQWGKQKNLMETDRIIVYECEQLWGIVYWINVYMHIILIYANKIIDFKVTLLKVVYV